MNNDCNAIEVPHFVGLSACHAVKTVLKSAPSLDFNGTTLKVRMMVSIMILQRLHIHAEMSGRLPQIDTSLHQAQVALV